MKTTNPHWAGGKLRPTLSHRPVTQEWEHRADYVCCKNVHPQSNFGQSAKNTSKILKLLTLTAAEMRLHFKRFELRDVCSSRR